MSSGWALLVPPVHAFGPHGDAALLAGVVLEQRQIEIAAFDVAGAAKCLVCADVEPQARPRS